MFFGNPAKEVGLPLFTKESGEIMTYNKSITATVYIVNNEKVLLHKHKKYNTWFPVGGHLEPDELPHQAAIREAKEETGLDITLVKTENVSYFNIGRVDRLPTPFCLYHEGDVEEQFLDFIYIGKTTQTEFSPMISESKELRWFSINELESENIKVHVKNTAITVLDYLGSQKL